MTRGEEMLALRRARMARAPAILRGGFRPFFFGCALWVIVAITLWTTSLAGGFALPTAMDPLTWHRHEMLFGFVGAAIAGFMLTAIPNWTGRLPVAGWPLAALFGLWIAARAAILFSAIVGPGIAALLDVGFFVILAALAGREVLTAKNRNVPIIVLVLLLAAAAATDHAGAAGLFTDTEIGIRAAIALVVIMISLIGGRIVPSFTRNWMARQDIRNGLPTQPGKYDLGTIALTGLAMATWVALPDNRMSGLFLLVAALLQAVRLARWHGAKTFADPLVLILHVGYLWIPVGLALLGASILSADVPRPAAIHALTAGAMGTMILAVMTRASLGHTGRPLQADLPTVFLYVLVTLGALLRVLAGLQWIEYTIGMEVAAFAWAGAFAIFVMAYGPVLFTPRIGER